MQKLVNKKTVSEVKLVCDDEDADAAVVKAKLPVLMLSLNVLCLPYNTLPSFSFGLPGLVLLRSLSVLTTTWIAMFEAAILLIN